MINYQEEIKRFRPSLDVDNIEEAIAGMSLTDMNDLMMQLVQTAVAGGVTGTADRNAFRTQTDPDSRFTDTPDEG